MRKLLLLTATLIGILVAQAENYAYLTFVTTDGAKVSIPSQSLNITISGTTLTAGSETFTLSNLRKMYFTTDNQTSDIKAITANEWDEAVEVFDLNGRKIAKEQALKGVYIVKSKSETHKIVIK
ncbi:MAG: T9SS type A sorting domain-containing protein [Bacteroidaceae bacterium]|nr:T9SS type A sorting domain-containing protein [Bacteroidaceae bacterium]